MKGIHPSASTIADDASTADTGSVARWPIRVVGEYMTVSGVTGPNVPWNLPQVGALQFTKGPPCRRVRGRRAQPGTRERGDCGHWLRLRIRPVLIVGLSAALKERGALVSPRESKPCQPVVDKVDVRVAATRGPRRAPLAARRDVVDFPRRRRSIWGRRRRGGARSSRRDDGRVQQRNGNVIVGALDGTGETHLHPPDVCLPDPTRPDPTRPDPTRPDVMPAGSDACAHSDSVSQGTPSPTASPAPAPLSTVSPRPTPAPIVEPTPVPEAGSPGEPLAPGTRRNTARVRVLPARAAGGGVTG